MMKRRILKGDEVRERVKNEIYNTDMRPSHKLNSIPFKFICGINEVLGIGGD